MWSVVLGFLVSFCVGWVARWVVNYIFKDFLLDALSLKTSFSSQGSDLAWDLLGKHKLEGVSVVKGRGDYYSPSEKAVYLSKNVRDSDSVGAAAVAAHECGHAQQFEKSLFWVPMVSFAKVIDLYVILLGVLLSSTPNGKILLVHGEQKKSMAPLICHREECLRLKFKWNVWMEKIRLNGEDYSLLFSHAWQT